MAPGFFEGVRAGEAGGRTGTDHGQKERAVSHQKTARPRPTIFTTALVQQIWVREPIGSLPQLVPAITVLPKQDINLIRSVDLFELLTSRRKRGYYPG